MGFKALGSRGMTVDPLVEQWIHGPLHNQLVHGRYFYFFFLVSLNPWLIRII